MMIIHRISFLLPVGRRNFASACAGHKTLCVVCVCVCVRIAREKRASFCTPYRPLRVRFFINENIIPEITVCMGWSKFL